MAVNKVILIGHLGVDPKVKQYDGGQITSFTLATSEKYKDKETTEWHYINLFGRLAEVGEQFLKKGSKIYLEGKIHYNIWDKDDGTKGYQTVINGLSLQMLDSKRDEVHKKPIEPRKPVVENDDDDGLPF